MFIATLPSEICYSLNRDCDIMMVAKALIGLFMTQVYNTKRPHSAFRYLTPVAFEQQYLP